MVAKASVLGLGSIGLRHAGNLQRLGLSVTGFDPNPTQQAKARQAGIALAPSRETAISTADVVVVATPTGRHLADMRDAVRAGKPVFVEKPLSHIDDSLDELLGRATAPVFPALILRHDAAVNAARDTIAALGNGLRIDATVVCESFLPDWRPGADHTAGYAADPASGGALFDHIHEVDLAWFLFGPLTLQDTHFSNTGFLNLKTEERAELDLTHGAGRVQVVVDYAAKGRAPRRETQANGPWGRLKLDILARSLEVWDSAGRVVRNEILPGDYQADYVDQMKLFINVASGRAQPSCTIGEALAVLRLVFAARRDARTVSQ
jgi:predicted dehydrogenase